MVTVLSKTRCVQCTATCRKLDELGVEYKTVNMSEDGDALARAKELGHLSAPVVIAPDGSHWSGYRPDLLEML